MNKIRPAFPLLLFVATFVVSVAEHSAGAIPFPSKWGAETGEDAELRNHLRLELSKVGPFRARDAGEANAKSGEKPLATRLVSFATEGAESRYGWVRVDVEPTAAVSGKRLKWGIRYSDAEVSEGKRRNAAARRLLAETIQEKAAESDESIQAGFYESFVDLWIDAPALVSGGGTAEARRAEDGIPSAEAILEWFAGNESFCESVRSRARTRLERMKAPPPAETNGTEEASAEPASEAESELGESSTAFESRSDAAETISPADRENGQ